jgi:hypothetical protein
MPRSHYELNTHLEEFVDFNLTLDEEGLLKIQITAERDKADDNDAEDIVADDIAELGLSEVYQFDLGTNSTLIAFSVPDDDNAAEIAADFFRIMAGLKAPDPSV